MNGYKTYLTRAVEKSKSLTEKQIYRLAFRLIWFDFRSNKITESQRDIYRNLLLLDYFLLFYSDSHVIPLEYNELATA